MKLTLIAAAAVPLALAACSSSPAGSSTATPSPVTAASPAVSAPTPTAATPAPAASPSEDPDPEADGGTVGGGRIGGPAIAVPGDVKIAVGKPVLHSISAAVGRGAGITRTGNQVDVFAVSITNTGKKPIDMTLTAVNAYASGEQLDGLSDADIPADNHFSGTLLPGKTMKATWAFILRNTDKDLQVEAYVGEQGASHGIFTGGDGTT